MSERERFRERLLQRLLSATGAGSVGLALAAACGGNTTESASTGDPDPYAGGRGGASGSGGSSAGGTFSTGGALTAGTSGTGGGISFGGTFSTGGAGTGGTFPDFLDAGAPDVVRQCVGRAADAGSDAGRCSLTAPEPDSVYLAFACPSTSSLGSVVNVTLTETLTSCCYDVQVQCYVYVGRAFLVDEGLLKAPMRRGDGWRTGGAPEVRSLSQATRLALSEAWLKDGLFEHASVATFARFAMQLLAVGAPSRLLHETLAAGKDEIRHAELCFALASAYAGESLEPDRFPIGENVRVACDLEDIVAETIVEGCIGETLAALQAAEQARRARDPAVVAALVSTVEDETRHAELAWRVVAWALAVGGQRVRRVVERTFAEFRPPDPAVLDLTGVDREDFEAHGRLSPDDARASALEALDHVVRPCAAALLGIDVRGFHPATRVV